MRRASSRLAVVFSAALLTYFGTWHGGAVVTSEPQATATSPAIDPVVLKALRWRSIGPPRGGRSIAVSGVKGRPQEAYFGAVGGGLWKTTDGGETWAPVTDGQIRSSSVGAVAVSESNPDIVFIGMGESCIRGNIMPGDGVYKSTDAGKTWTHVGFARLAERSRRSASTRPIPTSCTSRRSASTARRTTSAASSRAPTAARPGSKTLFRDNKTGAVDISIDRAQPERDLRGAVGGVPRRVPDVERRARQRAVQVAPTAARRGRRSRATRGCRRASSAASACRCRARTRTASTRSSRTRTAGCSCRRRRRDVEAGERQPQHPAARVLLHARDRRPGRTRTPSTCSTSSAFRSTDGGKTLTNVGGGTHGDHHDLWIDPDDPQHLVIGNDGGGAVSMAGRPAAGRRRISRRRSTTTSITTKHVPYHVCGAQQDGSTVCVPSDTSRRRRRRGAEAAGGGGGGARRRLYSAGGSEPGYIAPDPKDLDVFFAGGNNGAFLTRLNRRTGRTARSQSVPAHVLGRAVERAGRALAVDVPDRVLAGRSERALHVVAARLEDDQRRTDVGQDQRRPHAPRSEDDGPLRRADHRRHERARGLRHGVRARPGEDDVNVHVGRIGRRAGARHA